MTTEEVKRVKRILIIEDDPNLIKAMTDCLEREGYAVFSESDARFVVTEAKIGKPDIIIADVMMPGVPGGHAVHELQADKQTTYVPTIVMSGIMSEEDAKHGININGRSYPAISKPFNPAALLEMVRQHIRD